MRRFNAIMKVYTDTITKLDKLNEDGMKKKEKKNDKIIKLGFDIAEIEEERAVAANMAAKMKEMFTTG